MSLRIRFTATARRQADQADSWWQQHRSKAPNAVREELQRTIDLLATNPHIGGRTAFGQLDGVRRVHIQRVHYDVYYRITGRPSYIQIIAFWSSFRASSPPD